MPIRFRCKRCNQMLGISSRKAGSQIQCPKCGISQVVPSEEAAAAAMAMNKVSKLPPVSEDVSDLVVYDDEPRAIELPPPPREQKKGAEKAPAEAASTPAPPMPGQPVPRGMILFRRRTLYIQALLLLILAGGAFATGYFIGRGDARFDLQVEKEESEKAEVPIRGKLVYDAGGRIVEDENAVIIVLPAGKLPQKKMEISGIRPQDPPLETHKTIRRIVDELEGAFGRADASGEFYFDLPDQGKYHVLLISSHAKRPENSSVDEFHLTELEQYFTMPERLIDRYKYRWSTEEINAGFNPIEHNFGLDGK